MFAGKTCASRLLFLLAAFLCFFSHNLIHAGGCQGTIPTRTLTVLCDPTGSDNGQVLINCCEVHDLPWSGEVPKTGDTTVEAVPPRGVQFGSWSGDVPYEQFECETIVLSGREDLEITVHWEPIGEVTANIDDISPSSPTWGDTVHFAGSGLCLPGHDITACEWRYRHNGIFTVFGEQMVFDYNGLYFGEYDISFSVQCSNEVWSTWIAWSGNPLVVDSGPIATLTVTRDPGTVPQGTIILNGENEYSLPFEMVFHRDEQVSILALPPASYQFDHWSGDVPAGSELDNPLPLTMSFDRAVSAYWSSSGHEVTAYIDEITKHGNAVYFEGHGICSMSHDITGYEWIAHTGGGVGIILGEASSFWSEALGPGEYDIALRVQCSQGTWSPWVEWGDNPLVLP